jgi:hypothetical protein
MLDAIRLLDREQHVGCYQIAGQGAARWMLSDCYRANRSHFKLRFWAGRVSGLHFVTLSTAMADGGGGYQ